MSRLTLSSLDKSRPGGKDTTRPEQQGAFDGWIIIGRVTAPHGRRGELRVAVLTDLPERFQDLKRVYVGDAHTPYEVERTRFTPKGVLLKLAGIGYRDQAALLARAYIALPEAETPPLPEGSYHHHQIKGLQVITTDGCHLGIVNEIIATGSNDVYIVQSEQYGELLLPAIAEVIEAIDLDAQRIVVQLIPGLLPD